jgi:hypothetical protein
MIVGESRSLSMGGFPPARPNFIAAHFCDNEERYV